MRRGKREHFAKYKEHARALAHARLAHYNRMFGFSYRRVFIRNQRSRWGSCSSRKNLSFNYKIALLPEDVRDYIIVHELCHLKEFNHSPRFWALVAEAIPEHKSLRAALRHYERAH